MGESWSLFGRPGLDGPFQISPLPLSRTSVLLCPRRISVLNLQILWRIPVDSVWPLKKFLFTPEEFLCNISLPMMNYRAKHQLTLRGCAGGGAGGALAPPFLGNLVHTFDFLFELPFQKTKRSQKHLIFKISNAFPAIIKGLKFRRFSGGACRTPLAYDCIQYMFTFSPPLHWTRSRGSCTLFNNYSPKWRWIAVDIYRAALAR